MENVKHAMQENPWQVSKTGGAVSTNQRKAFATIAEPALCVCCRSADHMISRSPF